MLAPRLMLQVDLQLTAYSEDCSAFGKHHAAAKCACLLVDPPTVVHDAGSPNIAALPGALTADPSAAVLSRRCVRGGVRRDA